MAPAQARRAWRRALWVGVAALVAMGAVLLLAGRLGALAGVPPTGLGVRDGLLAAPSLSPNSVSSQARQWPQHPRRDEAHIEPLHVPDAAHWEALAQAILATPGARVVQRDPHYLRVEFRTRWLGFVDDAEFWWTPEAGVVHVRSASRLGHSDLGLNRGRIEGLRAQRSPGPDR